MQFLKVFIIKFANISIIFFLCFTLNSDILDKTSRVAVLDIKEINIDSIKELSALAYKKNNLYALSNLGVLYRFFIKIDDDKIASLKLLESTKLKSKKQKPLKKKKRDSEGMVLVDGRLYISFERKPRVDVFLPNGTKVKKYKIPKKLRDIKNYQSKNKALESIAYSKKYGILVAPEIPLVDEDKNYHTIYAKDKTYKFSAHAKLTALEFMGKDELLALERSFSYIGFKRKIYLVKVYLNRCEPICKSELLAEFDSKSDLEIDNFEGLCQVDKNRFLMVSDDNGSFFQKTLLVLFEIVND